MKSLILFLLPPSVIYTITQVLGAANESAPDKVFEPTAWFGLLGPVLAAIGIIGAAWGIKQSGAVKAWEATAEAAKERASVLEKNAADDRVRAEEREKARLLAESQLTEVMEALKLEQSKRDLSPILEQVLQMQADAGKRYDAAMKSLQEHDEQVAERHVTMQAILSEITKHLVELSNRLNGAPDRKS